MKLIGKVKDAHSLRGDLYILVFSGDVSWLSQLEEVELRKSQTDSVVKKLTIKSTKVFKDGFILKSNEITDRTAAESLKGYECYIDDDLLISNPGETIYLSEILNFELKNPQLENLGIIVDFSTNTVQDLLVIKSKNEKLFEVPFVQEFIREINFDEKFIIMDLPDGLMDLDSKE